MPGWAGKSPEPPLVRAVMPPESEGARAEKAERPEKRNAVRPHGPQQVGSQWPAASPPGREAARGRRKGPAPARSRPPASPWKASPPPRRRGCRHRLAPRHRRKRRAWRQAGRTGLGKPGSPEVTGLRYQCWQRVFGDWALGLDRTPSGLLEFGLQVLLTRDMRRVEGASDPFARQVTQGAPADGANAGAKEVRAESQLRNNAAYLVWPIKVPYC